MSDFRPTEKQREAQALLGSGSTHCLLEGGSRSGKTFWILRAIAARAIKAPGARAAVLRFRFNHLKASILADTWPKMLGLCFPGEIVKENRSDWYSEFSNGSQVWWGGLDEKERVEKILGQEHATIFLNECSQIAYSSRGIVVTRLAQKIDQQHGKYAGQPLPLRMYYDANPPRKGHWLYKMFHQGVEPQTGVRLPNPENFCRLLMNPTDNRENLPPEFFAELDALPKHLRERFRDGIYAEENPNALFASDWFERWRDVAVPEMQRTVVAVDPSGADDETSDADEIGITVQALGKDGHGYLLEDLSGVASPAVWGGIAASAAHRHGAIVVGERNFGGAMVKHTVQTAAAQLGVHIRYKDVTASRGKVVRAEPLSALYEQGRIRHVGDFPQLEDEMLGFSTTGYTGEGSPNRADALVWGMSELFPGMTRVISPETRGSASGAGYVYDGHGYSEDVDAWKVA